MFRAILVSLFSKVNTSRKEIIINMADIEWKAIKGGGPGGQSVNKTSSCIQLLHKPSGIIIKTQKSRDLDTNKNYAIKFLKEKLDEQINGQLSLKAIQSEKIRKQNNKRQKRSQVKYQKQDKDENIKQDNDEDIKEENLQ